MSSAVAAAVVDQNDFELPKRLRSQTGKRGIEEMLAVAYRHQDRNLRGVFRHNGPCVREVDGYASTVAVLSQLAESEGQMEELVAKMKGRGTLFSAL